MEHIREERQDDLLILTLARGKANALNYAMIEELYAAIQDAATNDSVRAVVLASDRPRFFSSGFDFREVFGYDRQSMSAFFGRFIDVYEALYAFPKPSVAALSGHTFAGGAILAISCDFRIMAEGDFGFALNEINLGLSLTPGLRRILTGAVGVGRAREILLFGDPISPAKALEIGLVREVAPETQVRERAISCARSLAAKPANAFREIKRSLREVNGTSDGTTDRTVLELFLDMWFSPEAQCARKALAAKA